MPRYIVDIPEVYRSVTRPVNLEVSRQLMKWLGLTGNEMIVYNGDNDSFPLPNASIDDQGNAEVNRLSSNNKLFITTEEIESPQTGFEVNYRNKAYPAVFLDERTQVYVAPIYAHVFVTVSMTKRFHSRSEALRWRNRVESTLNRNFINPNHTVQYHYPLPMNLLYLLDEVWKRRERVAPYGEDINTYFKRHFTDEMTVIANMAGQEPFFAIRETQANIIGNLEFTRTPYPVKASAYGSYEYSFTYRFEYDRISNLSVEYPLMVHNQFLPRELLPVEAKTNFEIEPGYDIQMQYLRKHLHPKAAPLASVPPGFYVEPYFDSWLIPREDPMLVPQYQALLQVDDVNQKTILTLTDLGDYQLFPEFLDYVRHCGNRVFVRHHSLVHIQVFSNTIPIDNEKLTLDPVTTNVDCLFDMNLRHEYRLVLNLDTNLVGLTADAVDDLLEHGWWLQLIIGTLYPGAEKTDWWPIPDANGHISQDQWVEIINHFPGYTTAGGYELNFVLSRMLFSIIAKRSN